MYGLIDSRLRCNPTLRLRCQGVPEGVQRGSYANHRLRQLDPKATLSAAKLSPLKRWSHIIYEPLDRLAGILPTCVVRCLQRRSSMIVR
jgi:hypothetical protein